MFTPPPKIDNYGKPIDDKGIRSNILGHITDTSKNQAGIVIVDLSEYSTEFIVAFLDVFIKQAENPKGNNDRFAKLKGLWIVDGEGVIERVWPKPPERIAPPNK